MQPGPPYPPQQPGQPQPWQPNPGQPPYGGPGFGQSFPGPPAPRKPAIWPIVVVVAIALAVIGAGAAAFGSGGGNNNNGNSGSDADGSTDTGVPPVFNAPPPQTSYVPPPTSSAATDPGRYQKLPDCTQLNASGSPFTFPSGYNDSQSPLLSITCYGTGVVNGSMVNLSVSVDAYEMPDGVSQAAQDANRDATEPVGGTGFENPPYIVYEGSCTIDYSRSNESVTLEFSGLPGVSDTTSCQEVAMPYAQQLYQLIG